MTLIYHRHFVAIGNTTRNLVYIHTTRQNRLLEWLFKVRREEWQIVMDDLATVEVEFLKTHELWRLAKFQQCFSIASATRDVPASAT